MGAGDEDYLLWRYIWLTSCLFADLSCHISFNCVNVLIYIDKEKGRWRHGFAWGASVMQVLNCKD